MLLLLPSLRLSLRLSLSLWLAWTQGRQPDSVSLVGTLTMTAAGAVAVTVAVLTGGTDNVTRLSLMLTPASVAGLAFDADG